MNIDDIFIRDNRRDILFQTEFGLDLSGDVSR